MARFHDLVGQLQNPGEDPLPPTIHDDLLHEYDNLQEGFQENTRQKDEELEKLRGEVSRLKSSNYDLLVQVPNGSSNSDDNDEEDNSVTIDGIFTKTRR